MMVSPRITPLSALGALLVFALVIERGWCISCWRCNSAYDPNCADPFDNITSVVVNCDQRHLPHMPGAKATVCRKIVQKVYNDLRYVRDCGWLKDEKEGTDCIRRAGTFSVLMKYCSCDTDGCNGAPAALAPSVLTWFASASLLAPVFSSTFK